MGSPNWDFPSDAELQIIAAEMSWQLDRTNEEKHNTSAL